MSNTLEVAKGYHRRVNGATTTIDKGMECDICHRKVKVIFGYEKSYPNNPDMWVCTLCDDELQESENDG